MVPNTGDIEVLDVSEYKPRRIPSKTWRECIKKVWEADPLTCPRCAAKQMPLGYQAEMKIISFITEPETIRRILEHLKRWDDPARKSRSPPDTTPPASTHVTYESVDDGWPGYEEPCITIE